MKWPRNGHVVHTTTYPKSGLVWISDIHCSVDFSPSITVWFPSEVKKIKSELKVQISDNLWILLHALNLDNYVTGVSEIQTLVIVMDV